MAVRFTSVGDPPEKECRPAGNGTAKFGADGEEALNYSQSTAIENGSQEAGRGAPLAAPARPHRTSPQIKSRSAVPDFERKVLSDTPVARYGAMGTAADIEADVEQRATQAWQHDDHGFSTPDARARELNRLKAKAIAAHNTGVPRGQGLLAPSRGPVPDLRHFEVTQRMLDEGRFRMQRGSRQVSGGTEWPVLPASWSAEVRIAWATASFLATFEPSEYESKALVGAELIERTKEALISRMFVPDDKNKKTIIEYVEGAPPKGRLVPGQVVELMFQFARIKRIALAGLSANEDEDLLGIYVEEGAAAGTYVEDMSALANLAHEISPDLSQQGMSKLLGSGKLRGLVWNVAGGSHRVERTLDGGRSVACANGVFDTATKTLRDFDPEHDVFTNKLSTDCPLSEPEEPVRTLSDGTEWRFGEWLLDLFDPELPDAEDVVAFLWQVIAAVLRPGLPLGRAVFFYSESGNSGKGTLVELLMNLIGEGSNGYASIPLDEWGGDGNDFKLEPLLRAMTVLVDENDVGEYLPKLGRLKSAITGDRLPINRKHKPVVTVRFQGAIVQCMNGIVKTKDKTDSLYRRFIWVPFPKNFEGSERKEIKQVFLADPEVLSYILWHALHTEFGGSPESPVYDVPSSCKTLLDEVKVDNDTVRQFWEEYADKFAWDVVPNSFLYDTFKASGHYGQNNIGSRDFYKRLKAIVAEQAKQGGHWDAPKDPVKVGKRMDAPEPLILRFNMMAWMNAGARNSNDPDKVCRPIPPVQTRGLVRIVPRTTAAAGPLDDGSSLSGDGTARARKVTVDDLAALEARGFPIADSSSGSQDNRSYERS